MSDNNEILLARQPIYDSELSVIGYELLFRPEKGESLASVGSSIATSRVLLSAFSDNEINVITDAQPAFVRFTEELLNSVPPFDPELLVIELLEEITVSPELITVLHDLKARGYQIAVDDFALDADKRPLLELADIIKVELPTLEQLHQTGDLAQLTAMNSRLLAKKIGDHATFERCKALGCRLFQGNFLATPAPVTGRKLSQSKEVLLQLMIKVHNPDIEFKELVAVFKQDPMLSYKLLKLTNSAAYSCRKEITSLQMAVVMLGLNRLKSWATLLALGNVEDKPNALKRIALQRACFCEQIAELIDASQKELYFTVGLLSCLDAFLDRSLNQIVASLPLDQKLAAALLKFEGEAGLVLQTVLRYEQFDWDHILWEALEQHNIDGSQLRRLYFSSISWANKFNAV